MGDLSPISGKLEKLLPRLASDAPGEVVATVAAIDRTLRASGCDWHDLAARLKPQAQPIRPTASPGSPSLVGIAAALAAYAVHRLTPAQRDFLVKMRALLASQRRLTAKQEKYLRDLHARHCAGGAA